MSLEQAGNVLITISFAETKSAIVSVPVLRSNISSRDKGKKIIEVGIEKFRFLRSVR